MDSPSPLTNASVGPSSSGSYLLLTTSPTLAGQAEPSPSSPRQRTRSTSTQPGGAAPSRPRFLPALLVLALVDFALVCGYGLPVALRERNVWVSEAVGVMRVGVMAWVALSAGAQRKKGAVLAVVVLSFLLLVYKINETFQRHKFTTLDPTLGELIPPLLPPNALAWYAISFALSLVHFLAYSVVVGVHNRRARRWGATGRERRQSVLRSHEQRWRGREESVRVERTPRFGPQVVPEGDIPSLSEEEEEGAGEDEDDGDFDEEDDLSEEDEEEESSSDAEDIIDMPKSGAASLRHRVSRSSLWREPDAEEGEQQPIVPRAGGSMMPRSVSRRSGMSLNGGHTTYGSFGGI